ncbi:epoxide hydrolase family protein [Solicola sp. PLA-1-18]|uniref:epoxide hydrolase family protein n=1 Tax=Solicola sp. PLA-1-18 TaxID=3380532 RepID=UPI003B78FFE9
MDHEVEPFTIQVPDDELDDLHRRLDATRWAPESPDEEWVRGIPTSYLRELAEHWRHAYVWRAHEARLNELPQFTTTIDGQRVHFLHVRSPEPDATPLIVTHGWPGSVAEFLEVVGPLADPRAHGGDPADAFHVVAPSIPGFAFSTPVTEPGWNVDRIARTFAALMSRLGYERYAAQGGDWGSHVSRQIGVVEPEHVIGVHLNMLMNRPSSDAPLDGGLTDEEHRRIDGLDAFVADGQGYQGIQSTRPQTLAHGLTDSPVGQLGWIAEKFHAWTDNDGTIESAVDRDALLTTVSLYWFTRTAGSSAQIYYESTHPRVRPAPSTTPTAVAVFPHDIALPLRRVAEQTNRIVRWTEMDRGGHFAAMEEPDLLVDDVRAAFRDLR